MSLPKPLSQLPGANWLSAKLSRKMVTTLLVLVVLGWLFSFTYLLHDLQNYAGHIYDSATEEAQSMAQHVASFLEGSQGDHSGLTPFLTEHRLGCCLQSQQGKVLFQFMPDDISSSHLAATSTTTVQLPGQQPLLIHIWTPAFDRNVLVSAIGHEAFVALTVFNLALFGAAAILLYVLIVAPIIGLRRTMQTYTQEGALPHRSPRRDEIGRLQNSFADLIGLLQAKEQSEHRLIASISHDIKTPLTSVLGYSERLLNASLSQEKQQQYLHGIHDKGLAIKSIVDEFDTYLEAGLKDSRPMEHITAGQLCQTLNREFQGELADAGIAFTVHCPSPEAEVLCDIPHMSRCLGNLISNSIRHAEVTPLELGLSVQQEEDFLTLEFSDNGVGVPPALLQQIFEPLYTTDRGRKVSGLGLSICRSIVQSHGGSITAANRPEGGLLVRILLPLVHHKK